MDPILLLAFVSFALLVVAWMVLPHSVPQGSPAEPSRVSVPRRRGAEA
jgi:hypothetical protein